jgi:hypothetical protein
LVTAVRLGAFNGLQLVARTRTRHRGTAAIVLGEESDRGLFRALLPPAGSCGFHGDLAPLFRRERRCTRLTAFESA